MKKKYLAEIIGNQYLKWENHKIIIKAPTGMGKTTFISKVLLSYVERKREKMLILCNRRSLRKQYSYDLNKVFDTYDALTSRATVKTYQEIAEELKRGIYAEDLFKGFSIICLDEFHYFYSDSDFNGFGTYVLFYAIMVAGLTKTMFFFSATGECIEEYIKPALLCAEAYLKKKYPKREVAFGQVVSDCRRDRLVFDNKPEYVDVIDKDFMYQTDYSYIKCKFAPDWETACGIIAMSDNKSLIFIDDKEKGSEIRDLLVRTGKIEKTEISILNADVLEDRGADILETLVLTKRLPTQVLITTSVLDNGVSICDPALENIIIVTENKVSFLQMLGRVRKESVKTINLIFIGQKPEKYKPYVKISENMIDEIRKLETCFEQDNVLGILERLQEVREYASFFNLAKFIIIAPKTCDFLDEYDLEAKTCSAGNAKLIFNDFARRKVLDLYKAHQRFYDLSVNGEEMVALEQIKLLDKDEEDLEILKSTYQEVRCEAFIEEVLQIQDFTKEMLTEKKTALADEFWKDDFMKPEITKRGSFANDKLETILEKLDLQLSISVGKDKKNRYSVIRKESTGIEDKEVME